MGDTARTTMLNALMSDLSMGHIVLTDESGEVTPSGERFLSAFGADLRPRAWRIFGQPCLDWSERRYHLKVLVGARVLNSIGASDGSKRVSGSRALQLMSSGTGLKSSKSRSTTSVCQPLDYATRDG